MLQNETALAIVHGLFSGSKITLVTVENETYKNSQPPERIAGILCENVTIKKRIVFKGWKEPIGYVRRLIKKKHLYICTDDKTYRLEN